MEENTPMVSIIVINYNTFEFTKKCIASILEFTKGVTFEILLVDNASTECSPDEFQQLFPMVRVLASKTNLGFAGGNTFAIPFTIGQYILLLNSDTELKNDCIRIGTETLKSNKELGAVSVKLMYPDGKIQPQCTRFPSVKLLLLEKLRLHKLLSVKQRGLKLLSTYFDHQSYVEPDAVWGTFFLFPKAVLEKIPGKKLNDDYFMYYEDLQWCIDLKKCGYKIAYQPEGELVHYYGKSKADKSQLMKKSKDHFLKSNFSGLKIFLLKMLNY